MPLGVWDLWPLGAPNPRAEARSRGEPVSTHAPASTGGSAASRPSRSQRGAGEKVQGALAGPEPGQVHISVSLEPGRLLTIRGHPQPPGPGPLPRRGGNGTRPPAPSCHPPRLQIPGGPVLPKPPLCSPAAHVWSGPLLKQGQGTSTGPARGTFPEPSRQVGRSPFHVSPAPGGSFPPLRTPSPQRGRP